jgi:hypothetical protein
MFSGRWFSEKFAEWAITGILGIVGAAVLTFLKLHQSVWATPLLYGVAGAFMVWICGGVFIAVSRIPRFRTQVTVNNVEDRVRKWLDGAGASVKNDLTPDAFFRLTAQLQGGGRIIVGRPRAGLTEHVVFRAEIITPNNAPKELTDASKSDQDRLLDLIKLELARAKVGYSGLTIPLNDCFAIFKSVRISDYLHEDTFLSALWDVEAAINQVNSVYLLSLRSLVKP